jgi:anthranilate/para-aminobenzoate synthase component I
MITDLERNDLGRVCEYGSVRVRELFTLERFEQVYHLVATVEGMLRRSVDHFDLLEACWPGGSISGAPKIRAMEIIEELEPVPRGLYTGAIGYFGFNGETQFSIAIRTLIREAGCWHFHVGAGIVADSDPEAEWEETLHKASGILRAAGAGAQEAADTRAEYRRGERKRPAEQRFRGS